MLCSLKRKEPKKNLHYSQSLVAFVNTICFVCSEKSLSLYFKSKVPFLCLWHFFFFLSSERIQANFMVFFPSFPLYNSSFCPVESSTRMTDWSIDNLFSFARHISFLLLWFQRGFLGDWRGRGIYIYSQSGWLCLVKNSTLWNIFAER